MNIQCYFDGCTMDVARYTSSHAAVCRNCGGIMHDPRDNPYRDNTSTFIVVASLMFGVGMAVWAILYLA